MLRQKSFIRKTRKGHVVKVVREHYLRDDIYCGSLLCKKCGQQEFKLTQPEAGHYLILDTNVILPAIDLLNNPALRMSLSRKPCSKRSVIGADLYTNAFVLS